MFAKTFDLEDVMRQAIEFVRKVGIEPYDESDLIFDGEIHRFRTKEDKPYEQSGSFLGYIDGWPAGFVQDWRKGIKENWKYDVSGLSDEQRTWFNSEEFAKRAEEERIRKNKEREAKQREATAAAQRFWESSKEAEYDHPYLCRKQVYPYGLRVNSCTGDLCIPLRDIDGRLKSIQFIPADKNKHKTFWPGAPLEGAFFSIALDTLKDEPTQTILLGEGYATMAKVYELTSMPCVAAMSCGNLRFIARKLHEAYPDSKIIITADNDWETMQKHGYNPGIREARTVLNSGFAHDVIFPEFSSGDKGCTDWDDLALKYGDEIAELELKKAINFAVMPSNVKELFKKGRIKTINAQDLRHKEFKPVNWVIPGIIPAGFTVLAGGPKVGKSILALHLALGIAIGGRVLSQIDVPQGDVLYLALEDTERRLQQRIQGSHIGEDYNLSRLDIVTQIPRQDEGGLEFIKLWLSQHPEAKLVIVDTLQKFRKQSKGKLNVYAEDYDTLAELKAVADQFNVAFVVIHHLKKMSHREEMTGDWINHLSGSAGITGCADTILALRRDRSSTRGVLRVTGRDVEEKDFNMKLDGFGWVLEGEIQPIEIPEWKQKILAYLNEHEKITPMQLSQHANISIEAAKKQLQRGVQELWLKRIEHGVYVLLN